MREIEVMVSVQVDSDEKLTAAQEQVAAREAIENALRDADAAGFVHSHAGVASVGFVGARLAPDADTQDTAECSEVSKATFPRWRIVHWDIPARMDMPPIRLTWYAGGQEAARRHQAAVRELFQKHPQWGRAEDKRWTSWVGNLWIGTEGVMYTFGHGCSTVALLPEEKFKDVGPPPQSLPRPLPGKFLRGWVQGMGDGPAPMGNFSTFSCPFTEWYLLANVASLFPNETLEFDPVTCRIINHEEANLAIRPPYREGWTL